VDLVLAIAVVFVGWDYGHPGYKDALRLLADMKTTDGQPLVRNLALTNFDTVRCRELVQLGIPIVSNQVQFSMLDRRPLNSMIPFFEERGDMKVLAYGVLAGGYLTDKWLGKPPPRSRPDTASLGKYLNTIQQAGGWGHLQKVLSACRRVADKHGVSIANVAIRWVLEQPAVAAVIVSRAFAFANIR
jgi:aryl-alcohol dehydrogenase-like predicted oxidoreductase